MNFNSVYVSLTEREFAIKQKFNDPKAIIKASLKHQKQA